MEQVKKFAVLIDADNTSHANIEVILEEIAKYGTASVKRIYGDWGVDSLKNWQDKLLPNAITPVQQFAYIKGKDATDMKLVVDAMDLLYAGNLDGFCIVSSDSDFTPLVSRIRESGRLAYGFGKRNTSSSFISACDKFIYIENLIETKKEKTSKDTNDEQDETIELDRAILQLIYKAIAENDDDDGWANLGSVGKYISSVKSDFDCRTYGSPTLSNLIKKIPAFEMGRKNRGVCVRKFNFPKFLKYIDKIMNSNQTKISSLIEQIKNDKNTNEYKKLHKEDLELKIKAIYSKNFIVENDIIKKLS